MIKAIIFDIDGVLLDSFEANLKFFQNLMITTGYRPPTREEFPALFHLTMMDVVRKLTGAKSEEEIMRVFKLGESRSVDYPIELLNMPDGAAETIRELNKKYLLGIVTSRVKNTVYEAPKLEALKDYFQVAVSYDDTDNHKPHPDPLLLAAQKLGVAPAECVYVGDVENDIKAARVAGMKFILYSKEKIDGVDVSTSDFREIIQLAQKMV